MQGGNRGSVGGMGKEGSLAKGITKKEGLHPVGLELASRVEDGSGLGGLSCLFKSS